MPTATTITAIASAGTAVTLGAAAAGEVFNAQRKTARVVEAMLTEKQEVELLRELTYEPRFAHTKKPSSDHPVMGAFRDLERDFAVEAMEATKARRILMLGCGSWEIYKYASDPRVTLHFAAAESKDLVRMMRPLVIEAEKRWRRMLSSGEKKSLKEAIKLEKKENVHYQRKLRFSDLLRFVNEGGEGNPGARVICGEELPAGFDVVMCFDSIYSMGFKSVAQVLRSTGASEMIATMMVPENLLYDNPLPNPFYLYKEQVPVAGLAAAVGKGLQWASGRLIDPTGKFNGAVGVDLDDLDPTMSMVGYKNGSSGGYVHSRSSWSWLLKNPMRYSAGTSMYIHNEVMSRSGMMWTFRIWASEAASPSVRVLSPPEHRKFVHILDLFASFDDEGKMKEKKYIPVLRTGVFETLSYLFALKAGEATAANTVAFLRRHIKGNSMAGKEYEAPWGYDESTIYSVAIVLTSVVAGMHAKAARIAETTEGLTKQEPQWRRLIKTLSSATLMVATLGLAIPALWFYNWLKNDNLLDCIMLEPTMDLWQSSGVQFSVGVSKPMTFSDVEAVLDIRAIIEDSVEAEANTENKVVEEKKKRDLTFMPLAEAGSIENYDESCWLCKGWAGKLGEQIVCARHSNATLDMSMTTEEVNALKNEWIDALPEAPSYMEPILEDLIKNCPVGPWENAGVSVSRIEGPPGTGKSFSMRLLYSHGVMIYAPFGKLRVDYMSQELPDGSTGDMFFKTTHKGIQKCNGIHTVFVDEYTAMDWRMVAAVLRNSGAKKLVIVGDEKQTGLRASEGQTFAAKFGLEALEGITNHRLRVNFRNKAWYIALMNKHHGYDMIASKAGFAGPVVRPTEEFAEAVKTKRQLNFSHATADTFDEDQEGAVVKKTTVRSNQGSTHEDVALIVGEADHALIRIPEMQRVALTRQKGDLEIFVDSASVMGGEVALMLHKDDLELWGEAATPEVVACLAGRTLLPEEQKAFIAAALDIVEDVEMTSRARGLLEFFGMRDVQRERMRAEKRAKEARDKAEAEKEADEVAEAIRLVDEQLEREICALEEEERVWKATHGEIGTPAVPEDLELRLDSLISMETAETCFVDVSSEEEAWEQVLPGLGKVRYDPDSEVPKPGASLREFFRGTSWCSLIAIWRAFGGSVGTAYDYVLFCYRAFCAFGEDWDRGIAVETISEYLKKLDEPFVIVYEDEDRDEGSFYTNIPFNSPVFPADTLYFRMTPDHIVFNPVDQNEFTRKVQLQFEAKTWSLRRQAPVEGPFVQLLVNACGQNQKVVVRNWEHVSVAAAANKVTKVELKKLGSVGFRYKEAPRGDKPYVRFNSDEAKRAEAHWAGEEPVEMSMVLELPIPEVVPIAAELEPKPVFDAYRFAHEVDRATEGHGDTYHTANEQAVLIGLREVPRNGVFDPNWRDPVVKAKASKLVSPKKDPPPTMAISVGSGNWFNAGNNAQMAESGAGRYLKVEAKVKELTHEGRLLAKEMWDKFQEEHMFATVVVDKEAEAMKKEEWVTATRKKMYARRADGEPEWHKKGVRYFAKAQYKPVKNGKVSPEKVGQGISAWSPAAVLETGGAIRIASHRLQMSLKDHCVFDNQMTELQLATWFNMVSEDLPPGAKVATTDVKEMDSIQDLFTQEIEKNCLRYLGFQESFVAEYYQYRRDYPIMCQGVFTAKGGTEKTSGEPGTLLFNSVLSGVFTNFILRGIGPACIIMKGDDVVKKQLNLSVDEGNYARVKANSRYRAGVEFGTADFCGKVSVPGGLYPSLLRQLNKLVAQRFKSREHFYQYLTSVRDRNNHVKAVGTKYVLMATAMTYKRDYHLVQSDWDILQSFSHLSYEQFLGQARSFPTPKGIVGMLD